jgi:uncharacterized protein YbjT (DUF2867 family)
LSGQNQQSAINNDTVRVLVTGGTGGLGHELAPRLVSAGYTVRVMSRGEGKPGEFPEAEWAQANLETGQGLAEAVTGIQIIVHAASNAAYHTHEIDVEGTRRLLEKAKAAGASHFLYVSIVGIERVPLDYYRHKLAAEAVVAEGGVPWTILRATQFHTLIDGRLHAATRGRWPLVLLPTDLKFQPIDVGETADRICECVAAGPGGRAPDIGGPEVLTYGEMARLWLAARGMRRLILPLPRRDEYAKAVRRGYLTCPEQKYGKITWAEWVRRKHGGR